MKKLFNYIGFLAFACFMAMAAVSCRSSPQILTKELYDAFESRDMLDDLSDFRFYVSSAVVLTEVVPPQITTDTRSTRVRVTSYNNVVNLKHSTKGRVEGTPTNPQKLEIYFEELKGTRPKISFIQKRGDGRYYFEFEMGTWVVMDRSGRLVTHSGPAIQYNGSTYLLEFKGEEEPYLLYDQDVKVRSSSRTIRGVR